MILDGEYERGGWDDKCALFDGNQHLPKANLGGKRVTMVNDRVAIISIPTVKLDAPAARQENLLKPV